MQTIQFIQITPEEMKNSILEGMQYHIEKLRAEFQPKEPTTYLTRAEVAELLKIDLSTLHNWTKKGKVKAYGIGNRVYYKRDELYESIIPLNPNKK